jgi:membrane associated rhomboid family serine protease
MVTLLALLMVLALVLIAMAPAAREQFGQTTVTWLRRLVQEATRERPEWDRFNEALRQRTPWALATPAIVALNVVVFALLARSPGSTADPEALVGWGANFWLNTRNGEWWRLVTAIFVHAGVLHLLVNMAGMLRISLILERQLGAWIVAAVFVSAGVFANLANLATHPMEISVGASGAVCGLYGLLIASFIWGMRRGAEVRIPLAAAARLWPAATVFAVYTMASGRLGGAAELTGLLCGLFCGALLARRATESKPAPRPLAQVMAGAFALAVLAAIPLRGATDVKPVLAELATLEERTAEAYREAADQFRRQRITSDALASLIDETLLPELEAADARLKGLVRVPLEHRPLVAEAETYVQLRAESLRLRAEWLRALGKLPDRGAEAERFRTNHRTIARAEDAERAALEVLARIHPAAGN